MKNLFIICFLGLSLVGLSQNVGINSSAATPDPSAMLDIVSTNKGLLIPRVALTSTTDVTTIPSPVTSLMVYNTNTGMTGGGAGFYYYDGSAWRALGGGSQLVWNTQLYYTGAGLNINSLASAQTVYLCSGTGAFNAANEGVTQQKMPKCLVTRLRIYINNNTITGATTFTLRKNGVSQAITFSIAAGGTGAFESTGAVSFNDGDLLSIQGVIGGAAGGLGILRVELTYY